MSLIDLTDNELNTSFRETLIDERQNLIFQLEHYIEFERRRFSYHYSSLWTYLTDECGVEASTAERRIRAARILKKTPEIKGMLESGQLNISLLEIGAACAHRQKLSDEEQLELLKEISGMSCRRARKYVASLYGTYDELPRDQIRPINEEYSEITFAAKESFVDKFEQLRGLLAHSHSKASMAEILEVALDDYLERHHPENRARRAQERELKKSARESTIEKESQPQPVAVGITEELTVDEKIVSDPATQNPTQTVKKPSTQKVEGGDIVVNGRNYSAALFYALIRRDGYVCSYFDEVTQKKCCSTYKLEVHHERSWAQGGPTSLQNCRIVCNSHHARLTFLEFGEFKKELRF